MQPYPTERLITKGGIPTPSRFVNKDRINKNDTVKSRPPWSILVVDDEPDMHASTSLVLNKLVFAGRGIRLLHAHSAAEAKILLAEPANKMIAVALIDVVMENDESGLQLVHHIRHDLNNHLIRLIIRTGQPGHAPERKVIENYDIDDYKEKTELTSQKLFTTIRLALKVYSDILLIEKNKIGLEYILSATQELYNKASLEDFLTMALTKTVGLFDIWNDSTTPTDHNGPDGLLITQEEGNPLKMPNFICGTRRFQQPDSIPEALILQCQETVRSGQFNAVSQDGWHMPLMVKNKPIGMIHLENIPPLQPIEQQLLAVMTRQITAALENQWLTRQLLHTERLATLGTFSAGVAHEIKNPNSFISGNVAFLQQFWQRAAPILAEALQDQPTSQVARFLPEIQPALEGIDTGSQRISTIVDSLKSYATGNRSRQKQTSLLTQPLSEAQTLLQHRFKHGTQLIINVPEGLTLSCNVQEISQVFINLFNNAMDAMDEHGPLKNRTIWVKAQRDETGLKILIQDNGPGIPKSIRDHLFTPFFTTKGPTRGTGLGLSIVKGIIENHQGRITIAQQEPPGATFVLFFP